MENTPKPNAPTPIAVLRERLGLTLAAFGARVGMPYRSRMSEIERGVRQCTPLQALAIEEAFEGEIDAADISPIIAAARKSQSTENL